MIAHVLHFGLSEIGEMTMPELERWHETAIALLKAIHGAK